MGRGLSEGTKYRMEDRTETVAHIFDAGAEDGSKFGKFLQWGGTTGLLAVGAGVFASMPNVLPSISNGDLLGYDIMATGIMTVVGLVLSLPVGLVMGKTMREPGPATQGLFLTLFGPAILHVGAAALPVWGARKVLQGLAIGATKTINGIEGGLRIATAHPGKRYKRR